MVNREQGVHLNTGRYQEQICSARSAVKKNPSMKNPQKKMSDWSYPAGMISKRSRAGLNSWIAPFFKPADFGEVELEQRVFEHDLHQRG